MRNVIGYVRVSTDNQAKEDKFGLEVQREQIGAYCEAHEMTIVRWVEDAGESGAKERPGMDELAYGDTSNPPIEAVVVAKTDRVARDIKLYYYYKMLLSKKNIELISISEDFGDMGIFAPMLEAFLLVIAEQERHNINARTTAGRKVKAAQGGYSGGKPPYGYKVVDHKLVVNEEEAEVVREIFLRKGRCETFQAVADALNRRGAKSRTGAKFSISTVQGILGNKPLYQGMYRYANGEWVKGQHEAILKEEQK